MFECNFVVIKSYPTCPFLYLFSTYPGANFIQEFCLWPEKILNNDDFKVLMNQFLSTVHIKKLKEQCPESNLWCSKIYSHWCSGKPDWYWTSGILYVYWDRTMHKLFERNHQLADQFLGAVWTWQLMTEKPCYATARA